jgi:hypothetical protein
MAVSATVAVLLGPAAIAEAGETTVVSRVAASGPAADGVMKESAISADGRFVGFVSTATNLGGPTDGTAAVYVKDTQTGAVSVVTRANGAAGAFANTSSSNVSISSDGRYVAFASTASNLGAGGPPGVSHVYVRDTVGATTTAVDRLTGTGAALGGYAPVISGNGQFVVFEGLQDSYSGGSTGVMQVYVRDLGANTTTLVSRSSGVAGAAGDSDSGADGHGGPAISISSSGRFVAFVSTASNLTGDANPTGSTQVFLRDTASAVTSLTSRAGATGNAGDGDSTDPSVAADGTVAFTSQSTNLGGNSDDAYVRPAAGTTMLVSRAAGLSGAEEAIGATPGGVAISADGSHVAWVSSSGFADSALPNVVGYVHIRSVVDGTQQLADVNDQGAALAAAAGPVAISGDGSYVAFMASPLLVDPTAGSNVEVLLRDDIPAPTAGITTPVNAATYNEGQVVDANYSCTPGAGATLQSCLAPVANGSPIDTSTLGQHAFTVRATDGDGQTGTTISNYTVVGPPSASIVTPADGAVFVLGQVVKASYSCQESAGGPGIQACTGRVATGHPIDTSAAGSHSFTVTATSKDGQTTTVTSAYTVTPPPVPSKPAIDARIDHNKHTATFTFTARGARGFQCALVRATHNQRPPKPRFSACSSPKTYEKLKTGKYTFEVRAISSSRAGPVASKTFRT